MTCRTDRQRKAMFANMRKGFLGPMLVTDDKRLGELHQEMFGFDKNTEGLSQKMSKVGVEGTFDHLKGVGGSMKAAMPAEMFDHIKGKDRWDHITKKRV